MSAYLVRLKDSDEEHARELIGIFVAETMEELYWIVDEAASPCECECLKLGTGGIHWERHTEQRVPRDMEPDWEDLTKDWSPLPPVPTLTEGWDLAFAADGGSSTATWEPIIWSLDKDDPPEPPDPPALRTHVEGAKVLPFKQRQGE